MSEVNKDNPVLCWGDLSNISILFCIYISISFGLVGALDDYKKKLYYDVYKKSSSNAGLNSIPTGGS